MAAPLPRILVADDERSIRRLLNTALGGQYAVLEAATGAEALTVSATAHPDAILLDLGLPDIDGLIVMRQLREWTEIPIIVISVREREEDKVLALDAGADDYLTKPFSVVELLARLRVALRRTLLPERGFIYRSGALTVNLAQRMVLVNNQPISLTPTEYDLLCELVRHAGRVITHQQLIQSVWGHPDHANAHLLRANISNLRQKIESDPAWPHHIVTEPGVGYRLRVNEVAS
jgi:two-component system KDP operon response regulator KdpE